MIDPRRLRVLVEVARCGSISAAAESLSFVPSAVSQQINALEREAGVPLTARAGRGIVLTSAGRLLVEHGEEVLRCLTIAESALQQLNGLAGGRVRVASFRSAGAALIPNAFATLAAEHPGLHLSLVEREPQQSLSALSRHDVDVALVYQDHSTETFAEPGIAHRLLMTDTTALVAPRDHPLCAKECVAVEDAAQDTWIAHRQGTSGRDMTINVCRNAGFEPHIAYTTDDIFAALRMVGAGLGVSMVPTLALTGLPDTVGVIPLASAPTRAVSAAWRRDTRSEAVGELVNILAAEAGHVCVGLGHTSVATVINSGPL